MQDTSPLVKNKTLALYALSAVVGVLGVPMLRFPYIRYFVKQLVWRHDAKGRCGKSRDTCRKWKSAKNNI